MVNEKMINRLVDQMINWFDNEIRKIIFSGRRISQASTASSLSGPEDEAGGFDRFII